MAKYAFVMGSNGPPEFGKLEFAESDAHRIAEQLQSKSCGYTVLMPTTNDSPYAVQKKLDTFAVSCKQDDTFICYYSGHGILDGGHLFLPWRKGKRRRSAEASSLMIGALRLPSILTTINLCQARNKLLILDCCHAGAAMGTKSGPIPISELIPSDNHLVLMASARLERARELKSLGGGFMSMKICEALSDGFEVADADNDQNISLAELVEWLEQKAVSHNEKEQEKVPIPFLYGQRKGPFLLAQKPAWPVTRLRLPDESSLIIVPAKAVSGAYCIAEFPVTNAQYRRYIGTKKISVPTGVRIIGRTEDGELKMQEGFRPWHDDLFCSDGMPVVCVSYFDARNYCRYVNRLLQNSKTLRGITVFLAPPELWTFGAYGKEFLHQEAVRFFRGSREFHHNTNCPQELDVAGLRSNSLGLADMIGNVWEWCSPSAYVNWSIQAEFRGEVSIRGGGFTDDVASPREWTLLESKLIRGPSTRGFDVGFRLAAMIPNELIPGDVSEQLDARGKLNMRLNDLNDFLPAKQRKRTRRGQRNV